MGDHRRLLSVPTRRSSELDISDLNQSCDGVCTIDLELNSCAFASGLDLKRLGDDPNKETLWGVKNPFELADRKSTRLNSSHTVISYAVFCLKKKNALGTLVDKLLPGVKL